MTWAKQLEFDIIFDWGSSGLEFLSSDSDIVVIVDVLSFSTCISVAVDAGAKVFPFPWKDERADEFAKQNNAILAGTRSKDQQFSLSPISLCNLKPGQRLVLPSPNGSHLCTLVKEKKIVTGCLRNAGAVARYLNSFQGRKLVLAAGERWSLNNNLRPAFEDLIGAGAIINELIGTKSPEAIAAESAWIGSRNSLSSLLLSCASGKELIQKGFKEDVDFAAKHNFSKLVPVLRKEGYFDACL